MMSPQRLPALAAAVCVLTGLVALLLAAFGPFGLNDASPVADRHVAPQAMADIPPVPAIKAPTAVASADFTAAINRMLRQTSADATPVSDDPIVVAALPPSQVTPETLSEPTAAATSPDSPPSEDKQASYVEILDECFVLDVCVDHYLWALYERTAKQDTSKVTEWRKVQVKKKRKTVTVRKRFIKLVDQDFTWKDPDAAAKAGMSMIDYVIGGMDREFKLKLFHALRAAEKAGLAPGITSGFRDDYRQSIASGMKAASNRSYHGGSLRGGYGYGVAADVVSVTGATRGRRWLSTVELWKWIDANEKEFGIGRPYLHKDPPHVAPIDGEEYASRRGPKVQVANIAAKKKPQPAARAKLAAAKPKARPVARVASAAHGAKPKPKPSRPIVTAKR